MKKMIVGFLIMAPLFVPCESFAIYCSNCSTIMQQLLDSVTNLQELEQVTRQVHEAMQQTSQQIAMVQNMIKNTNPLDAGLRNQYANQLTALARLTNQLNTQRGDYAGIQEAFSRNYPDRSSFTGMSSQAYRQHYDQWSSEVDRSTMATFQTSGRQLQDLQDSGQLEAHINNLLNTPEGQMEAVQASNQLAAVQIAEARQLRELLATKAQSDSAAQEKAEKREQAAEQWRQGMYLPRMGLPPSQAMPRR